MKILNGKELSNNFTPFLRQKKAEISENVRLTIVQVGSLFSSNKYIKIKQKKGFEIGVIVNILKLPAKIRQIDLIQRIKKESEEATGLIVQLPLPEKMETQVVLDSVPFEKDVDGLASGNPFVNQATPRGIGLLLHNYNISLLKKKVAVVGQSPFVGKPISDFCKERGAIVTTYDKVSGHVGSEKADILIVAAGVKHLIGSENIKEGAVVVDVGINDLGNKKVVGDVDFSSIVSKASFISPVPGGVGPMTVIALFLNLFDLVEIQRSKIS